MPFNVFMFNLLPYNEVNEQFSNENGNPGILLAKATFKMHQKNVLVHALFRDPLAKFARAQRCARDFFGSERINDATKTSAFNLISATMLADV